MALRALLSIKLNYYHAGFQKVALLTTKCQRTYNANVLGGTSTLKKN